MKMIVLFVPIFFGNGFGKEYNHRGLTGAPATRRVRSGFVGAEGGAERVGPEEEREAEF